MKVMVFVKGCKASEAGVMPSHEQIAAMGKFNEELIKAGILVAAEGLTPSKRGVRVHFSGKNRVVTDGPFAETKEHLAGYYIIDCENLDEAIEWAARIPTACQGGEGCIEIRPMRWQSSRDRAEALGETLIR